VRVLHLTDPHLFADRKGALRGAVTYDTLQSVISHCRQGTFDANLIALTGDIIQDDSAEAYMHCCDLLSAFDLPVFCVPGNHDVRHLMQDILPNPPFSYCDSQAIGNWLIVGIDSWSCGRQDRRERTATHGRDGRGEQCRTRLDLPASSARADALQMAGFRGPGQRR
jgi:Icc protein